MDEDELRVDLIIESLRVERSKSAFAWGGGKKNG